MAGLVLTAEDRVHFLGLMRRQINSAVHRRLNVLLLLDDGWEPRQIAAALYIDETTVAQHRRLYETGGCSGVEELPYRGRRSALDDEQQKALAAWIEERVPQTAKQVCAHVQASFQVSYTPQAMAKLLKRLAFVHKKPKSVPAKADEAVQRGFVEETLRPLMEAAGPAAPLYFVDATHPAYTGRPAHGWMRRGTTRELKSNHGRCHLNLNGALSWPERALVYRQEEKITSAAMIRLFEDLCAHHAAAPTITVVLDNARYNRSREIKAYLARPDSRIRLVYLPSYAPNLNLIERFWHLMKRKVLFNKAYAKFALFQQAFEEFFARLPTYAAEIRSLITERFHFIGAPQNGISTA
jgi:transposase